ncbi:MAG: TolB family protein [Candidatus Fervidibacter sp.]|uniref:TolB family protein n=1 Tax=Candidatus Fervidibacter sp. TaxID=3100871 RepID=UPI00404A72A8
MRWLLTILAAITVTTISMEQVQAQAQLDIHWLSSPVNDITVGSRFPSVNADGTRVVFQVGNGDTAQIWEAIHASNQWSSSPVLIPNTNQPLLGVHPVISADGNHIAFASQQDYGFGANGKQQVYVLDRVQNRIVPISFLRTDTDNDGVRDTYQLSNGNCLPVHVSSNGRIMVFMAQLPYAQGIVDADGDGVADQLTLPSSGWLVLIHDRDADGNGVYDEAGIGATRTFVGSYDWDTTTNQPSIVSTASVTVSANGRIIAFAAPDPNNPNDPERWTVVVRDWQILSPSPQSPTDIGIVQRIDDAIAPTLSDDGTYVAFLTPIQIDNDGDGQVNEDPIDNNNNDGDGLIDEDPYDPYPQTHLDLVVRQLIDPVTGLPPAQARELRLTRLNLLSQAGAADGTPGWGYSDWWGAVTVAVDPTNPEIVYVVFHAWATDLIDFQSVRNDLTVDLNGQNQTNRLRFYQGSSNIFLARFDFTNFDANPQAPNRVRLWRLTEWTDQQQPTKLRGLPISLKQSQQGYSLTLAPSLMPAISFVNGGQLHIAFQSLAPFVQADKNALWDVYLATVTLP